MLGLLDGREAGGRRRLLGREARTVMPEVAEAMVRAELRPR